MMTLRCTQRVLNRFKIKPTEIDLPSTNRLGDWYANLLFTHHHRLLLCTSEKSLLSVLIPVKQLADLESGVIQGVERQLSRIGIPDAIVAREIRQMKPFIVSTTKNRMVLGCMNDHVIGAKAQLEWRGKDIEYTSMVLAETPMRPIGMKYPREVAAERLSYWEKGQLH